APGHDGAHGGLCTGPRAAAGRLAHRRPRRPRRGRVAAISRRTPFFLPPPVVFSPLPCGGVSFLSPSSHAGVFHFFPPPPLRGRAGVGGNTGQTVAPRPPHPNPPPQGGREQKGLPRKGGGNKKGLPRKGGGGKKALPCTGGGGKNCGRVAAHGAVTPAAWTVRPAAGRMTPRVPSTPPPTPEPPVNATRFRHVNCLGDAATAARLDPVG